MSNCNFRKPLAQMITKTLVKNGLIALATRVAVEKAILSTFNDLLVILYETDHLPDNLTEEEAIAVMRDVEANFEIDKGLTPKTFTDTCFKLAEAGVIRKQDQFIC